MDNYIIMYSPFSNSLFAEYEQVQAKTYIEAAKKFVNGRFQSIKRSGDRDVNLAILRGEMVNSNTIRPHGHQMWYKCS